MRLHWRDTAWLAGLAVLVVACALGLVGLAQRPDGLLHLWALDVGQGDALLIQTPGGQPILIDGGPDPAVLARQLGRHLPFWQRAFPLVVLTHPHEDHLAGLIDVLRRYQVSEVLQTPFEGGTPALEDEWHGQLGLAQVPVTAAVQGQTVPLEPGLTLQVVYPTPHLLQGTHSDINNSSIVARLQYGTVGILLTGDIETEAVQELLDHAGGQLGAQVLKVPHHGSATGLSPALLAAVHPEVALISVGHGNPYGHPAPNTLALLRAAGVPAYRTDERGSVEVLSDGRQVWVRPEH